MPFANLVIMQFAFVIFLSGINITELGKETYLLVSKESTANKV